MIEKNHLSRDAQAVRTKIINDIAAKMSEDVALVLAYIFKASKKANQRQGNSVGATAAMIMKAVHVDRNRTRSALILLETTNFVSKVRYDRSWMYTVTEAGSDALLFLLSEKEYPGRKIKFIAILGREGGYI